MSEKTSERQLQGRDGARGIPRPSEPEVAGLDDVPSQSIPPRSHKSQSTDRGNGEENAAPSPMGVELDVIEKKQGKGSFSNSFDEFERRMEERCSEIAELYHELRVEIGVRRHTEALLQASLREWQETFDAAQDAICLMDGNFKVRRCNQAMLRFLGMVSESVVGRSCHEVIHCQSPSSEGCLMQRVKQTKSREHTIVTLNHRWFNVTADPVLDEEGNFTGVVHIMTDITTRKQAEKAKRAAELELAAQRVLGVASDRLRSLGEMAAGIAHELAQPLVGVRGLAEHLCLGIDRGWEISPETMREKLTLIVEQADRMSRIIEQVRMFAREAGKPEVRPVQVNEVIRGTLDMVGSQLRAQGITVECELAEDLPAIPANPFSLEEVLLNLISNARDAVQDNVRADEGAPSPRIVLRTLRVADRSHGGVELQVVDEGVGIQENLLSKVFDPFFTTKGPSRGTGIGLSICKNIVEQFGGRICLESTVGRGTKVTIVLPSGMEKP